jgi:hypothetical protein
MHRHPYPLDIDMARVFKIKTERIVESLGKLKLRVSKGWAAGSPYIEKGYKTGLGIIDKYADDEEEDKDKINSRVKISKAFKKKKS